MNVRFATSEAAENQATKIDGVIRIQKMSITKMVGKCHNLLLRFESNQKIANSILMKKTANEFHTTHTKLIETMNNLYQSTQDLVFTPKT